MGRLPGESLWKGMGGEAEPKRSERACERDLYRKPNTLKPAPGPQDLPLAIVHGPRAHKARLLRNLSVTRPNHVRAMDMTYIPWRGAFGMASNQWRLMPHSTLPPWSTGPRAAS